MSHSYREGARRGFFKSLVCQRPQLSFYSPVFPSHQHSPRISLFFNTNTYIGSSNSNSLRDSQRQETPSSITTWSGCKRMTEQSGKPGITQGERKRCRGGHKTQKHRPGREPHQKERIKGRQRENGKGRAEIGLKHQKGKTQDLGARGGNEGGNDRPSRGLT